MLYFIKIKIFCSVKDTSEKMKKQATDSEKHSQTHLIKHIWYIQNIQRTIILNSTIRKQRIQCKNRQRSEHTLHHEHTQMANMHVKRCSNVYAITELQMKMSYIYLHIGMAKIQKLTPPNTKEDVKQQEVSFVASRIKNGHSGRQFGSFLQK